jgi:hypothetical protein
MRRSHRGKYTNKTGVGKFVWGTTGLALVIDKGIFFNLQAKRDRENRTSYIRTNYA